jgi:hypothetical protein
MGYRHQAFLIARVAPERNATTLKYRCIAGIHHQWCRGAQPLEAARRFERLAKQKVNASLLLEDIRQYPERVSKNPRMPCPYAAWILQNAFSVANIDDNSSCSAAHLISADMGSSFFGAVFD